MHRPTHEPRGAGAENVGSGLEYCRFLLKRLRTRWESVQVSFWLIPAVMTALAGALALIAVHLDESM
ncbi:MAG TPA: hypothetical protein VIK18_14390 [Pirellulales bacterium]